MYLACTAESMLLALVCPENWSASAYISAVTSDGGGGGRKGWAQHCQFRAQNVLGTGLDFTVPVQPRRIFSPWKIRRLRPGLNPQTWVPKASTLPLDHRSPYVLCLMKSITNRCTWNFFKDGWSALSQCCQITKSWISECELNRHKHVTLMWVMKMIIGSNGRLFGVRNPEPLQLPFPIEPQLLTYLFVLSHWIIFE